MQESQLRDLLGKGLPKIAVAALAGVYPMGFVAQPAPSRDYLLTDLVVGSQLLYTSNIQVTSFLTMDPSQLIRLGTRAFPKKSRGELPKVVIAANNEAHNTIMAKLAYLIGRIDGDREVVITPPLIVNCSGEGGLRIQGADALFLNLVCLDISLYLMMSIQMV
jgi:hypothetical protein